MEVFSQKLHDFLDFFSIGNLHKSSFVSIVAIIKIITYKINEKLFLLQGLVKKIRVMLNFLGSLGINYRHYA